MRFANNLFRWHVFKKPKSWGWFPQWCLLERKFKFFKFFLPSAPLIGQIWVSSPIRGNEMNGWTQKPLARQIFIPTILSFHFRFHHPRAQVSITSRRASNVKPMQKNAVWISLGITQRRERLTDILRLESASTIKWRRGGRNQGPVHLFYLWTHNTKHSAMPKTGSGFPKVMHLYFILLAVW